MNVLRNIRNNLYTTVFGIPVNDGVIQKPARDSVFRSAKTVFLFFFCVLLFFAPASLSAQNRREYVF